MPLHPRERTGGVVFEDAHVRLIHLLMVVDLAVMMAHHTGHRLPNTDIGLLKIDRFLIPFSRHIQPQIRTVPDGGRQI